MSLHPDTNMIAQVNLNSKTLTAPQHLANFQCKWWESSINLIRKRKIFSRSQVKCGIVSLLQHNSTETLLQVVFPVFKRITGTFKVVWTLVLSFMLCKMLNWQLSPICTHRAKLPSSPSLNTRDLHKNAVGESFPMGKAMWWFQWPWPLARDDWGTLKVTATLTHLADGTGPQTVPDICPDSFISQPSLSSTGSSASTHWEEEGIFWYFMKEIP